ncbi:MAG: hypothetical protein ABEJ28_05895 [Salinigranum sp.]
MAEQSLEYLLGEYDGRRYFLSARARPGFDTPDEFAVVVHYNDPETESSVQVARIDTAHGYVHFDRLYRRDEPKEAIDCGFWEAIERLEGNWRTYARGHERSDR